MPRPSSTSASRPRRLLRAAILLGLGLCTILALDRVAFSYRASLHTANTGRWAYQEWREKQAAARRLAAPPEILFLGDSTMSRDLRPALVAPRAQNLARSGLQGVELAELDLKLGQLGIDRPRLIVLSMLPEQFRPTESDLAFLDAPRPGLGAVLRAYYARLNLSQIAFFPGTRVVKYHLDALVARQDRDRSFHIDPDGALLYDQSSMNPDLPPRMPGFMSLQPGYLDAAHLAPLEAFVRHWEARGTRVVYLFLPIHPEVAPAYEARFGRDLATYRAEVARIFQGRFIDLGAALPASAYYDATHLNADGAAAFSRLLAGRLAPYLNGTGSAQAQAPDPSAARPGI